MLRSIVRTVAASAGLSAIALFATAQTTVPGTQPRSGTAVQAAPGGQVQPGTQLQPGGTGQAGMPVRAKALIGTKMMLAGNAASPSPAGTIEDIVLNNDGVVDYLIVSNNGKLVTVPWDAAKFNWQNRTATINITPEQYQQIPTYTAEQYPSFYTPTYRTQIYKSYGLTNGQERRLERRERRQER